MFLDVAVCGKFLEQLLRSFFLVILPVTVSNIFFIKFGCPYKTKILLIFGILPPFSEYFSFISLLKARER